MKLVIKQLCIIVILIPGKLFNISTIKLVNGTVPVLVLLLTIPLSFTEPVINKKKID